MANAILVRNGREYALALFRRADLTQKLADVEAAIVSFETGNAAAANVVRATIGSTVAAKIGADGSTAAPEIPARDVHPVTPTPNGSATARK